MSNSPGAKCIALAIVLTAACSADAGPPSVTFLSVEPAEIALSVGDTIRVQWEVLPIGAAGSVALRAEGSVTVTRDGLVTAMRAGPGLVIASVGARADSSRISVAAPGEVGLFTQIEAGYYHACASDQQRHVFCWGPGSAALGLGRLPAEAVRIPEATASLAELTQLSGGGDFTCGLSTQSVVYCWGNDEYGQLGLGGASDSCGAIRCELFPTPIVDVLFDTVVAGGSHACALRAGEAYCWGYGAYGRLGDGSTVHRNAPTRVQGNLEFTRIAAGGTHTCAIARDDHGYCWGYSAGGQIGDGIPGSTNRILPTRVAADDRFVTVVTGVAHSCALTVDGRALCWGANVNGQVGNGGSGGFIFSPTQVSGNVRFATLSAGAEHTCGLDGIGTAYCWGDNREFQLGDETSVSRTVPTPFAGGVRFRSLTAGYQRTCGIGTDGFSYCWGLNYQGGLGTGSETLHAARPTRVANPR